jgi:hypothetical protein
VPHGTETGVALFRAGAADLVDDSRHILLNPIDRHFSGKCNQKVQVLVEKRYAARPLELILLKEAGFYRLK